MMMKTAKAPRIFPMQKMIEMWNYVTTDGLLFEACFAGNCFENLFRFEFFHSRR